MALFGFWMHWGKDSAQTYALNAARQVGVVDGNSTFQRARRAAKALLTVRSYCVGSATRRQAVYATETQKVSAPGSIGMQADEPDVEFIVPGWLAHVRYWYGARRTKPLELPEGACLAAN